ncbi:HDOD domain-containing protein [Mariprofundus erugo]|uniref:HDOD domain-containing protein n=1 Tax=Mariprofundus erugo TaxID=2528639 RepID=A0A5R9GY23_9PROT|nr:HDOD domain-containing protein [Mariprofundus erugo]TLS68722.1 HDOD domain-containing protein [Mariprofundus erugo]
MIHSGYSRSSTLELLKFSDDLPSLPDRFVKIQKVVQDPNSDASDLASVIRSDQATTAMILKFANSPAYNPTHTPVGELSAAIARIGLRETVHIATAMSLMYGMILPTGMANIRCFWGHAFAVAMVCEKMAHAVDPDQQRCSHERAFMTGLLHDIGRAALGMRVDFTYFERETGHLHQDALIQAEEEIYGVNHAEAGMQLLRLWLFPDDIFTAVGEHHRPDSTHFLGSICYQANLFCNTHLSDRIPFDAVHDAVQQAIIEHPFDLSVFAD